MPPAVTHHIHTESTRFIADAGSLPYWVALAPIFTAIIGLIGITAVQIVALYIAKEQRRASLDIAKEQQKTSVRRERRDRAAERAERERSAKMTELAAKTARDIKMSSLDAQLRRASDICTTLAKLLQPDKNPLQSLERALSGLAFVQRALSRAELDNELLTDSRTIYVVEVAQTQTSNFVEAIRTLKDAWPDASQELQAKTVVSVKEHAPNVAKCYKHLRDYAIGRENGLAPLSLMNVKVTTHERSTNH